MIAVVRQPGFGFNLPASPKAAFILDYLRSTDGVAGADYAVVAWMSSTIPPRNKQHATWNVNN